MCVLAYNDELHLYTVDGTSVPSLTQMLDADGQNAHLKFVPQDIVEAKADYGIAGHKALQLADLGEEYEPCWIHHVEGWLNHSALMHWKEWEIVEKQCWAFYNGFCYGFTPDRASWGKAVVEIKFTYNKHPSHCIQTALQVIGLGYPRATPRYVVYFDRTGFKHMTTCDNNNDYDEAERIICEQALPIENLPEDTRELLGKRP